MALNDPIFLVISLVASILVNSAVSSELVPVYLWQTSKLGEDVPALPHVKTDTFEELVKGRFAKGTVVVAFAEPNLSPEDFNTITQSGERVFSQLANLRGNANTVYLPQVQNPIGAIYKSFGDDVTRSPAKDFKVENVKTSVLIVELDDVEDNEDRHHMLARHDKIIVDIYEQLLKKNTNVVALFTGHQASWVAPREVLSRKVRDTESGNDSNKWVVKGDKVLVYASSTPTFMSDGTPTTLASTYKATVTENGAIITAELTPEAGGAGVLKIGFRVQSGYWSFETVELTLAETTHEFTVPARLYPPSDFSYQCTTQTFYEKTSKTKYLTFANLQIQPFTTAQEHPKFGDPYFCVGFTSPAIWSGIFITFIFAIIMAIGLMMMMDMKTMDRFDDPKGKTIIINATD